MKLRVLGGFGGEAIGCRPSSFLLDGTTLLDAGSVSGGLSAAEQAAVEQVLVSHAHLDHIGGLAFLTETRVYAGAPATLSVLGLGPVVNAVHACLFNNTLWPDLSVLPSPEAPIVSFRELPEGAASQAGRYAVTALRVDHTVPAAGFVVHDGREGLVYSGDTGPTRALWDAARATAGIRAMMVECSFPDRMLAQAQRTKHLCPSLLQREMEQMPAGIPLWVFHVKPMFADEIREELARVDARRILVLEQGKTYET